MKYLLSLLLLSAGALGHEPPLAPYTQQDCVMHYEDYTPVVGFSKSQTGQTARRKLEDDDSLFDGIYHCIFDLKFTKTGNPKPVGPVEPIPEPNEPAPDPNTPPVSGNRDYCGVYDGIVYMETPHSGQPVSDSFTDSANVYGGFSCSSIVQNDLCGNKKLIEPCVKDGNTWTAAVEPRVSPDGKKVLYSLVKGTKYQLNAPVDPPVARLRNPASDARLVVANLETGEKIYLPHREGDQDRGGDWISNVDIAYSTNRDGTIPADARKPMHKGLRENGSARTVYGREHNYKFQRGMRIARMRIDDTDGSSIRILTPASELALRPTVLMNGDILYSDWVVLGHKANYSNTSPNPTTPTNLMWLCRVNQWGGDPSCLMGAHRSNRPGADSVVGKKLGTAALAIRVIVQLSNGWILVIEYYRGNHNGLGFCRKFKIQNMKTEGMESSGFVPSTLENCLPFSEGQDSLTPRSTVNGLLVGKAGYPSPLPNNDVMVTWGRGWCRKDKLKLDEGTDVLSEDFLQGQHSCDYGIYFMTEEIITDPFTQLSVMVDDPTMHEIDAHLIGTYQEKYGQPMPVQQAPYDESKACTLQIADIRNNLLKANKPYKFGHNVTDGSKRGSVSAHDVGNIHDRIKGIRLLHVGDFEDRQAYNDYMGNFGKPLSVMGDVMMEPDGSIFTEVPCETKFLITGINDKGEIIVRDDKPFSLQKGETVTCGGCHDELHSEEGLAAIEASFTAEEREAIGGNYAAALFGKKSAGKKPPQKNLFIEPYEQYTFTKDIWPDIQTHCAGCHEEFNELQNQGLLDDALVHDREGIDLPNLYQLDIKSANPRHPEWRMPPYSSHLVHARFPRESPLYWIFKGERTDGRTSEMYGDDLDYLESHPHTYPEAAAERARSWLSTGAMEVAQ